MEPEAGKDAASVSGSSSTVKARGFSAEGRCSCLGSGFCSIFCSGFGSGFWPARPLRPSFTAFRGIVANFARRLVGATGRGFFDLVRLFRVFQLHEVGHIEEGVALQADIDKS